MDNFNELSFDDEKGSELINLQAEQDMAVLVRCDERRRVAGDRETISSNAHHRAGRQMTISAGRRLALQVGGSEIVLTPNRIEVTGELIEIVGSRIALDDGASGVSAVPHIDYNPLKPGIAGFDTGTIPGAIIDGLLNQAALLTSAFRKDVMTQ